MNDWKNKAIVAAIGIIVILAGVVVYQVSRGQAMTRRYLEAKGRADQLAIDYATLKKQTAEATAASEAKVKDLEQERQRFLAYIAGLEKSKADIAAEYAAYRKQTSALPDDGLSAKVNERIGSGASWPVAGPPPARFSFTRPGVEATLDRFLNGEEAAKNYVAEQGISSNLRTVVAKTEGQRDEYKSEAGRQTVRADKAEAGWEAEKKALSYLERSIPGTKWKARLSGAAFIVVLDLALRAAGVLK